MASPIYRAWKEDRAKWIMLARSIAVLLRNTIASSTPPVSIDDLFTARSRITLTTLPMANVSLFWAVGKCEGGADPDVTVGDELWRGTWMTKDTPVGDELRRGMWMTKDAATGDELRGNHMIPNRYHPIPARYQNLIHRKHHPPYGQSVTLSVCHHPGGPVPIAMHACLAINPAAAVQYTYQVVRIIHPTNLTPVFGVSY
uniref:Uncharacterized protein n=1 Tax=Oryza glumipatula TaxID=40148 RepID=A0A0D9YWH2_9ORYZ